MSDTFHELARHYDAIMDHIDYDRWVVATSLIAEFAPQDDFAHLDVACGTGVLLKKLRQHGMHSVGFDLSPAMAREAHSEPLPAPAAVSNMTRMPFPDNAFSLITCVFDSVNFLLDPAELDQALLECARVLRPGGLAYFDVITEAMVQQHFADQQWEEKNGKLRTVWKGRYDAAQRLSILEVQIGTGFTNEVVERVHTPVEIEQAIAQAGLEVLGEFDSETWKPPTYKSVRVDYILRKPGGSFEQSEWRKLEARLQGMLR